jgi:hypothetical protein
VIPKVVAEPEVVEVSGCSLHDDGEMVIREAARLDRLGEDLPPRDAEVPLVEVVERCEAFDRVGYCT